MMLARHLLMLLMLVSLPVMLCAQFDKGTNNLGLHANGSSRLYDFEKRVNANGDTVETNRISRGGQVTLSYFRFISEKTAIGLEVGYSRSYNNYPHFNDGVWTERIATASDISISPQLRYHFPLSERWVAFVNNELFFRSSRQNSERPQGSEIIENRARQYTIGGELRPGILWMMSDKWSLEASVFGASLSAYAADTEANGLEMRSLNLSMLNGFSLGAIQLGIRFYF